MSDSLLGDWEPPTHCVVCRIPVLVPEGNCDPAPSPPFYCAEHFQEEAERRLAANPGSYYLRQAVARC